MFVGVVIFVFLFIFASHGVEENSLIVTLNQGKIQGFEDVSSAGELFYSFLKIPYAKPPIAQLRFENPQPPNKWSSIRDGTQKPPSCAQFNYYTMIVNYNASFEHFGEEDCLFLNVYTKQMNPKEALPVMVFFHGGGYAAGGTNIYEPHNLLDEDIVLITVQYRLGILGFLWTGDSASSSNIGLKDQTFALRWIHENVAEFGGDPDRVTIFGQSAGGSSVHAHLLSDYSNGLFSRAIVMSGTMLCPWARMSKPRETAMKIGDRLQCFNDGGHEMQGLPKSEKLIKCLRQADVADIMKATRQLFEWSALPKKTAPYVDGDFFTSDFETLVRMKKFKAVDVIYGVTKDEGVFLSSSMLTNEDQRLAIKDNFRKIGPLSLAFEGERDAVDLSKKAYDYYVGGIKNHLQDFHNLTNLYGDHHFKICSDNSALFHAELNEKFGKKTYFYEYHHRGTVGLADILKVDPSIGKNLVCHGDDLFSLFPNFFGTNEDSKDKEISKVIVKLLVNFSKHGDPTPDSSLGFKWTPFTQKSPDHLKILKKPVMEPDRRKQQRDFWKSLPTMSNKLLFGSGNQNKDEF